MEYEEYKELTENLELIKKKGSTSKFVEMYKRKDKNIYVIAHCNSQSYMVYPETDYQTAITWYNYWTEFFGLK